MEPRVAQYYPGAAHYYVMNYDGTGKIDLGTTDAPMWSPDGSIITRDDIRERIGEDARGYPLSQMTSPDAKRIAYVNQYDNLVVSNIDGTNKIRLVPVGGAITIMWSPDSKKILYGGYGLINADGTGGTTLTSKHDKGIASWSPDGKMIAYQDASGESRSTMLYSLVVVTADNPHNIIASASIPN